MNNNDIHIEIGLSVVVAVARSTHSQKHETWIRQITTVVLCSALDATTFSRVYFSIEKQRKREKKKWIQAESGQC